MDYSRLRCSLRKLHSFQYLSCLKQYAATIMRNRKSISRVQAILISVSQIKPIFLNPISNRAKIRQYNNLIRRVNIIFDNSPTFLYWMDERIVLFQENRVIENIPLDYHWIVDKSLDELTVMFSKKDSKIAKQNLEILEIFQKYMNKTKKAIKESNFTEERKQKQLLQLVKMKTESASNLTDALQRILFWNQLLWQSGHRLNGLGRLDKILDRFPVTQNSYDEIKEFLRVLHGHYAFKSNVMPGDTGQIIILGGLNEKKEYFSGKYTYLILKAIGDLKLPDPKVLLRTSKCMPEKLLTVAIECLQNKCGSPLFSNDDIIIPALVEFGYSHQDACNYGVSACWEPLVIGKSLEQNNITNIEFASAFEQMCQDQRFINCSNFNEVMELYYLYLEQQINRILNNINQINWAKAPIFTMFTEGCLETDKDISLGGAIYNNYGLLSVGLASTVDSLLNIKRYVFESELISLIDITDMLTQNYNGYETQRKLLEHPDCFFGIDDDFVIGFTRQIIAYVDNKISNYTNPFGGKAKFGLSSPAYVVAGKLTGATADGRKAGAPFSTHISCTRSVSPTALVCFAGLLDYTGRKANGNVVDLILPPSTLTQNLEKFKDFVKGSLKAGVFQMQFNFISYSQLLDAKLHPENYPNLIVRVWGFSAYYNDLPEEYKDILILRAKESAEG